MLFDRLRILLVPRINRKTLEPRRDLIGSINSHADAFYTAERMKTDDAHHVPLTPELLAILEPLQALRSDYVFEGQKRHQPLSNMSMLMLLRRMKVDGVTVHGFRSTFRDWASVAASASPLTAGQAERL